MPLIVSAIRRYRITSAAGDVLGQQRGKVRVRATREDLLLIIGLCSVGAQPVLERPAFRAALALPQEIGCLANGLLIVVGPSHRGLSNFVIGVKADGDAPVPRSGWAGLVWTRNRGAWLDETDYDV